MRQFAIALASTLIFSSSAFAVTLSTAEIQNLPNLEVVAVTVDPGPAFAAVQPTAFLEVVFASCSKLQLETNIQSSGNVMFVSVNVAPDQADCAGPTTARNYKLQISSDFPIGGRVVVLNPVIQIKK